MNTIEEIKDAFIKHSEEDKDNFGAIHEALQRIEENQARMSETLKPIAETYTTTSLLGRWLMTVAVFVSLAIGAIIGIESIFKK